MDYVNAEGQERMKKGRQDRGTKKRERKEGEEEGSRSEMR